MLRPCAKNNTGFHLTKTDKNFQVWGEFFSANMSIYKACTHMSYFVILVKIEEI